MQTFSETSIILETSFQQHLAHISAKVTQHFQTQEAQVEDKVGQFVGECRADFEATFGQPDLLLKQLLVDVRELQMQNNLLKMQLEKVEKIFGGREVPWERILDMHNRVTETLQREVQREVELRERKVIEMIIAQQLDVRIKDFKKAEYFEKLREEITESVR